MGESKNTLEAESQLVHCPGIRLLTTHWTACCRDACAIAEGEWLLPWMGPTALTADTDKQDLGCTGSKIKICLPLIF